LVLSFADSVSDKAIPFPVATDRATPYAYCARMELAGILRDVRRPSLPRAAQLIRPMYRFAPMRDPWQPIVNVLLVNVGLRVAQPLADE
jgi:hypothetical protein